MDVLIKDASKEVWLSNCRFIKDDTGKDFVVGEVWDDDSVGSPYLPDDYLGEPIGMNFPVSRIQSIVYTF